MSDPTYEKAAINANPVWDLAWKLSEVDNDDAPIGWGRYIPIARWVLEHYQERDGKFEQKIMELEAEAQRLLIEQALGTSAAQDLRSERDSLRLKVEELEEVATIKEESAQASAALHIARERDTLREQLTRSEENEGVALRLGRRHPKGGVMPKSRIRALTLARRRGQSKCESCGKRAARAGLILEDPTLLFRYLDLCLRCWKRLLRVAREVVDGK